MKIIILTTGFILFFFTLSHAQQNATVREYTKVFKTYPFSDPDPIPNIGRVYPYFRFDGYTDKSIPKEWKVVELENDYIKVMILPEIGGKIWAAIEKSTGKSEQAENFLKEWLAKDQDNPITVWVSDAYYGKCIDIPNETKTDENYRVLKNLIKQSLQN